MSAPASPRPLDILTLEVGSTITKANGFRVSGEEGLVHCAQGFAATTVTEGDVGVGVDAALADLKQRSGLEPEGAEIFLNSSAAGGLRVTVHGLTTTMTARAAREASLGAGAITSLVTAGELTPDDLEDISEVQPNMMVLAGGVDFGARGTVLKNAERLAGLDLGIPVIFAGNNNLRKAVRRLFEGSSNELVIAENVFPDVDVLNVRPLRKKIQEAFSRHIVNAPGMKRIEALTDHPVLPTPGAVLRAAELFAVAVGDVLVIDVGGATTDVHSVTDGSPEYQAKLVDPEPRAKRTVEGDLGVFVNAGNILEEYGEERWTSRAAELRAIPQSEREQELTAWLCRQAVEVGIRRHAGSFSNLYTPSGRKQIVKGKDLTAVRWVVGTGGALTRVPGGRDILADQCKGPGTYLLPPKEATVFLDADYLFSALGTLAGEYPDEVGRTFQKWGTRT